MWLWPLLLAAMIVIASGRSAVAAPDIISIDKVGHFAVFGLLATLVARAGFSGQRGWWAVLIVSLFGLTDEWHQSFTPGRYVEIADWVADTLGAVSAVGIYIHWRGYREWLEWPLFARKARVEKHGDIVPNKA